MAFFGVSTNLINCGTPSASQKSESSDMSPYQAVLIAREARMRGITAAQQTFARLQFEYGQAYAAYQQLQANVAAKAEAVEAYFNGEEAAVRSVCEKAAQAKLIQMQEGGSDYTHPKYKALVAGLSADRVKAIDDVLLPYYTFAQELENAENALWAKHASLQAAQEVHKLWMIELNAADMQLQTMPAEQSFSTERNLAELRHLAQRVAEIRRKRILQRKKEKTVVRHLVKEEEAAQTPQQSPQDSTQQRLSLSTTSSKSRTASAPPPGSLFPTESKKKSTERKTKVDFDASSWL